MSPHFIHLMFFFFYLEHQLQLENDVLLCSQVNVFLKDGLQATEVLEYTVMSLDTATQLIPECFHGTQMWRKCRPLYFRSPSLQQLSSAGLMNWSVVVHEDKMRPVLFMRGHNGRFHDIIPIGWTCHWTIHKVLARGPKPAQTRLQSGPGHDQAKKKKNLKHLNISTCDFKYLVTSGSPGKVTVLFKFNLPPLL